MGEYLKNKALLYRNFCVRNIIYYLLAAVLLARKMADLTHAQCKNGAMSYTGVGLLL